MRLDAISSALPDARLTQPDVWELMRSSGVIDRIRPGSARLLEKVLHGDSGIDARHFGHPDLPSVFDSDPDSLSRAFEQAAPALATQALSSALSSRGLEPNDLDAILVCTCTGYLCPGISSHVAEKLGMKPEVFLQDLVGLGCGAAIPMLRSAHGFLAANPRAHVACIAVEVCSAAFYIDDDPGQLISLCLFGDAANATIWGGQESGVNGPELGGFDTVHRPEFREQIRFVHEGGGFLKNQLSPDVPTLSADAVGVLQKRRGLKGVDPVMISHGGGRDVLNALTKQCGREQGATFLEPSREILKRCGNVSSPAVMMALEHRLATNGLPGKPLWLTTFGAGFSAHSAWLG